MKILSELAPAIGGIVLGGGLYLYALLIVRKLRKERARDIKPAE